MEFNTTWIHPGFMYVISSLTTDSRGIERAIFALSAAFALGVVFYLHFHRQGPNLSHVPLLMHDLKASKRRSEFRWNAKSVLQRGYYKFNKAGKAFRVQTIDGPMVVLNAKQSEEVGAMPDHIVDNMRPNGRALMDSFLGYLDGDEVVLRIIKTQLSTRLAMPAELGDVLAEQTDKSLVKELPECNDWTHVKVYDHIVRIVAAVSTRIFAGEELTENEEWLSGAIEYTIQLVTAATILKHLPKLLLPAVYRLVPAYKKLRKIRKTAISLIKPIVQARREAMENPSFDGGGDNMMQWMLNERVKKNFHDRDYEMMAQIQLQLAFAAIHTTSMALVNMLYDLVAWPEYIDILREEVKEQLGNNEGSFRGKFIRSLPKLDSFMKESQRHNPVGYTIMGRDICEDITLSDGTFLPRGTFVVANGYQITHDPDILLSNTDPDSFDGLRYYTMRNELTNNGLAGKQVSGKHQFVSVSNSSMAFGYGKHACPGRFFAGNEIKLLLAKLLIRFDFKIPPDERGRYKSKSWEQSNYPDTDKRILMKRI